MMSTHTGTLKVFVYLAITLVVLAMLGIVAVVANAQTQKPTDLSPTQKLDIVKHVSKLRAAELEKQKLQRDFQQALNSYREKAERELQRKLTEIDVAVGVDRTSLDSKMRDVVTKAPKGWRLNEDADWVEDETTARPAASEEKGGKE